MSLGDPWMDLSDINTLACWRYLFLQFYMGEYMVHSWVSIELARAVPVPLCLCKKGESEQTTEAGAEARVVHARVGSQMR